MIWISMNSRYYTGRYFFLLVLILCSVSSLVKAGDGSFRKQLADEAGDGSLREQLAGMIDIVVAADGSGDYLSVQEGINAIPDNSPTRTILFIGKGEYREKIHVPSSKINLTLIGEDMDSTIIVYDDYAGKTPDINTFNSQTIEILPRDFRAMNITFENDARPEGSGTGQNVAVSSYGDRTVFLHCRFISWQDTYYTGADGRHYFKDCFIEGAVDYIFGHTTAIFDSCQIHTVRSGGYKTAASTKEDYAFGYVFFNSRLTSPPDVTGVWLGRPWKTYARTVFFQCVEYESINALGWKTWGGREETCFYAEYQCTGPGSDTSGRADWSYQLSDNEAAAYTMENIFSKESSPDFSSDWNPAVYADSVYLILLSNTTMFLDSANLDTRIASLKLDGEDLPDWDPGSYEYIIELEPGTTEIPEIEATASNPLSIADIEYPESLPGFANITILANDRASCQTYSIYLSTDNASGNALLDSIKIGGHIMEGFDPEVFDYEIVLPQGTSPKYYGLTAYRQVPDAIISPITRPELPDTIRIIVTAVDGTTNTYTIYASIATGTGKTIRENAVPIFPNPASGEISFRVAEPYAGPIKFRLFDLKGSLLLERSWERASEGDHYIVLDNKPDNGMYIYQLHLGEVIYSGKLIIKPLGTGIF
jgi:pectinesterase